MIGLILANAIPLVGVIILGWDAFAVVALYWLENVVIGVMNIVKMITCFPQAEPLTDATDDKASDPLGLSKSIKVDAAGIPNWGMHAMKLFVVPFFAIHYGMFTFVHGVFVFAIFGAMDGGAAGPFDGRNVQRLADMGLIWAGLLLAASHVAVLLQDYFWNGGYQRTNPMMLMAEPYPRVIVLHVAIIFGAMLTFALGSPTWFMVLLVAGKTALDVTLYRARRGLQPSEEPLADEPLCSD